VTPEDPPFARYWAVNVDRIDVEAGVVVASALAGTGDIEAGSLPGGDAAILEYFGPYGDMEPAYRELEKWVRDQGRQPAGSPWEVYYSDPEQEPDPQKWRTEIVMPLA
jgi:effector-binding domain-containing protein